MKTVVDYQLSNGKSEVHNRVKVPWEMDEFEVEDFVYDLGIEFMEKHIDDYYVDDNINDKDYEYYMSHMSYDFKYLVIEE